MAFCSNCGQELDAGATQCPSCGEQIQARGRSTKYCQGCGKEISRNAAECPYCGEVFMSFQQPQIVINNANNNTNQNQNMNVAAAVSGFRCVNWLVSFLLCLFLGYLGAHKFYEGKIGMGIIYLCTFGLFGIGWLIDIFVIMLKPKPYYYV